MPEDASSPPMADEERIDRFESAYNRIDRGLERLLADEGSRHRRTFATKVRIAANQHRRLARHTDFLYEIGELRNAMVHNRTGDDLYLAIPSERTVLELEAVEQRLLSPEAVLPRFQRPVIVLEPEQSLADAFELVREDGYSRYPVYAREGFVGLLTSNGFTRWIAAQVKNGRLDLDLTRVSVQDVLEADHRRRNALFVGRDAAIDDVDRLFVEQKTLEAVIITEHGRTHEKPLGMVCPPDLARLEA